MRGFLTSRDYRAAVGKAPSARQLSDDLLVPEIARLHAENYGVYGRRKMHALMRRQGWDIGRDQTERLMRLAGVRGVRKSKRVFTTRSDKTTVLPSDLINRRFTAPAPRRLWVCDVTYIATWSGFAYVAFVTDVYSRRIVGWNVAATLRAEILPLQALDMAAWNAGGDPAGLTHHSDHGSNYMAMVYTDRIVELGAVPSTGAVGDSFDNAMAEAVNNLYKTELIRQRGPWRTVEQVELATLEWVWWWNNSRLHGELDMRTPPRSRRRTTLTSNQPTRHLPDKAPDRNESQADSGCAYQPHPDDRLDLDRRTRHVDRPPAGQLASARVDHRPYGFLMKPLTDWAGVPDQYRLSFVVGEIVRNDVYAENEAKKLFSVLRENGLPCEERGGTGPSAGLRQSHSSGAGHARVASGARAFRENRNEGH